MAYRHAERDLAAIRKLEAETKNCPAAWPNGIKRSQLGWGRPPTQAIKALTCRPGRPTAAGPRLS